MQTKFKTKAGRLTLYALACGYIERNEVSDLRLDLWHEGACFHVLAHDFANHNRVFWESFDTLTDARKFFDVKNRELFA